MPVVLLPPEILRTGQPAPVSVRDAAGHLLWAKGVVLASDEQRQSLVSRDLFVDERDGELIRRALNGKLDSLLRQNTTLGTMADAQPDGADLVQPAAPRKEEVPLHVTLANLQMHLGVLLQDSPRPDFLLRLQAAQHEVGALVDGDIDRLLLRLVHTCATESHHHTATRALLSAVLCDLAARQLPHLNPAARDSLRCAALSLRLRRATIDDQLALQDGAPSSQQQALREARQGGVAECLRGAGVTDALWLQAVAPPPANAAGALAEQPAGVQLSRLLHRADLFTERLSLRRTHKSVSAAAAMKAACLDDQQQADAAGLLLLQVAGLHPPGSFVKLASGEMALVLRRGVHAKCPKVVSLISRQGTPLAEPAVRDTRLRAHEVATGITPQEVRVRPNLDKLLKLA